MAQTALINAQIFDGTDFHRDRTVVLDRDKIASVTDGPPTTEDQLDLAGDILAPGFIDLQVNGGGGTLFNEDPSAATIARIGAAHRRFGTTGFLPTLISADRATTSAAIAAVQAAIDQHTPGVLGIHLEGPFLNPKRCGAHSADIIRTPEPDDIALLCAKRPGKTLVTLAPEVVPGLMLQSLKEAGVIVFAGHTDATRDQIATALGHGLRGFTHLFNAMSQIGPREPGTVGAALEPDEAWCGIIVDGHHVHPGNLRLAVAQKPGRLFLITDAMATVGTEQKTFRLDGRLIQRTGTKLTLEDGTLAGSCLDMATAVRNAIELIGLPATEALRMASTYPARVLGLDRSHGQIAQEFRADLVRLNRDMEVVGTWIAGDYQPAGRAGC